MVSHMFGRHCGVEGFQRQSHFTRGRVVDVTLTSWYLMGKRTKRRGFSCSRGSLASSSCMVGAALGASVGFSTIFSVDASVGSNDAGAFSLPTALKSSFLAGESLILRFSREEAAYGKKKESQSRLGKKDASCRERRLVTSRTCFEGVTWEAIATSLLVCVEVIGESVVQRLAWRQ